MHLYHICIFKVRGFFKFGTKKIHIVTAVFSINRTREIYVQGNLLLYLNFIFDKIIAVN